MRNLSAAPEASPVRLSAKGQGPLHPTSADKEELQEDTVMGLLQPGYSPKGQSLEKTQGRRTPLTYVLPPGSPECVEAPLLLIHPAPAQAQTLGRAPLPPHPLHHRACKVMGSAASLSTPPLYTIYVLQVLWGCQTQLPGRLGQPTIRPCCLMDSLACLPLKTLQNAFSSSV